MPYTTLHLDRRATVLQGMFGVSNTHRFHGKCSIIRVQKRLSRNELVRIGRLISTNHFSSPGNRSTRVSSCLIWAGVRPTPLAVLRNDPMHPGMVAVVGHRPGIAQDRLLAVQDLPPPVALQDAPASLDRVVLAVVRRVVGQLHDQTVLSGRIAPSATRTGSGGCGSPAHCPGPRSPPHRTHRLEAFPVASPPLLQGVHHEVAGDLGVREVQIQLVVLRHEDAEGRQLAARLGSRGRPPVLPVRL